MCVCVHVCPRAHYDALIFLLLSLPVKRVLNALSNCFKTIREYLIFCKKKVGLKEVGLPVGGKGEELQERPNPNSRCSVSSSCLKGYLGVH